MVERLIGRLRRLGHLPKKAPTAAKIVNETEARLVICDSRHVLEKYLSPPKDHKYNLRIRPHNRFHDNSSTDISSTTLRLQTFRLQTFRLLLYTNVKDSCTSDFCFSKSLF